VTGGGPVTGTGPDSRVGPVTDEAAVDEKVSTEAGTGEGPPPPDLRVVALAMFAWAGGLGGFLLPRWVALLVLAAGGVVLVGRWRGRRPSLSGVAWLAAAAAVAASAMLRMEATEQSPVAALAKDGAFVSAVVRVTSDPLLREGDYDAFTLTRGSVLEVTGRGSTHTGRAPVLVIGGADWHDVELGSLVRVEGRAATSDGPDLAAVISTSRPPEVVRPAGGVLDAAASVRAGIRRAVAGAGRDERTLVPALVVGDDRGMSQELAGEFRTAGLTHLLAVSGTNLTLVVGFVLVLARWGGVRARGLVLVGIVGVAGFVLLARTEPSVVRAAAMGSVALIGLGTNGRERGTRALGVAVLVLLLLDPSLVLSIGFVLSALATAGILFLAPPWRDALMCWLPRWAAEVVSVPLAAQLVCTPVVAAISGQVSLVAVVANMVVAPAVGPATVLGLVGGLAVLVVEPAGLLLGRAAAACAWWITSVAARSADLPTAAVDWAATGPSVGLLTLLCAMAAWVMPGLLRRRLAVLLVSTVMLVAVTRPLPTPGWPPEGWVLVACDVGQGDGLILNAGDGEAVVVDVGPDPDAIRGCLDRLDVRRVVAVVLTHFHDDHVAGLPGVLDRGNVGHVVVTGLADPAAGARAVTAAAAASGVPVRVATYGEVVRVGPVTWQVVGPDGHVGSAVDRGEGSAANNASVAMLAESHGVRLLLTGDMEPEAQRLMRRVLPGLRADVLKVPHHGSRYQDPAFLSGLGARLAVISVGADNDYGHPAPETLDVLESAGMLVRRTDRSGDVAVVVVDGQLSVRELSTSSSAIR
jgi:competence protein ComEC